MDVSPIQLSAPSRGPLLGDLTSMRSLPKPGLLSYPAAATPATRPSENVLCGAEG
eukprot:CAMPEP_0183478950 /NCGR_PEP_ID=MMETSP0370-20130417/170800_1 /TAXON_ID=268820 /ORGANISM="Peridinium aciculiferum, Strain PAER-2" /LENGTH=54 /DNA_ID=CAMNT_0025671935 /DNA_START=313 /DNA_END=473 /DNA_ORIENTATION=-